MFNAAVESISSWVCPVPSCPILSHLNSCYHTVGTTRPERHRSNVLVENTFSTMQATLCGLRAVVLGSVDHMGQGTLCLIPGAGLEAAVGVDPELFGCEVPMIWSV